MIIFNQVMLYVHNQEKMAQFWIENLGFIQKERIDQGDSYAIILSDGRENGTNLVLQNKEFVAAMNSGVNLETPSILLATTDDIDVLYNEFKTKGITVGDLVEMSFGKVFNFADPEENYFAILQQ